MQAPRAIVNLLRLPRAMTARKHLFAGEATPSSPSRTSIDFMVSTKVAVVTRGAEPTSQDTDLPANDARRSLQQPAHSSVLLLAAGVGLEPTFTASKSVVLPLDDPANAFIMVVSSAIHPPNT